MAMMGMACEAMSSGYSPSRTTREEAIAAASPTPMPTQMAKPTAASSSVGHRLSTMRACVSGWVKAAATSTGVGSTQASRCRAAVASCQAPSAARTIDAEMTRPRRRGRVVVRTACSSSTFAKGIITGPDTYHICYCHSPARFAWMYHDYVAQMALGRIERALLPAVVAPLRVWDYAAAQRVDAFLANSHNTARRIAKF